MPRAFELERRGNYAQAAEAYRELLSRNPGDVSAVLGLERVLLPLNRSAEIVPDVNAALKVNASSAALYGVALRAWGAADQPDSMRVMAERWARIAPRDEAPYREWGAAALASRQREGALEAYRLGRQRLGRDDVLAAEMAQLAIADGDYATAAREWLPAVRRLPGYRITAVATLGHTPGRQASRGVADPRRRRRLHGAAARIRAEGPVGRSARRIGRAGGRAAAGPRRGGGCAARADRTAPHSAHPGRPARAGPRAGGDGGETARPSVLPHPARGRAGVLGRRRPRRRAPHAVGSHGRPLARHGHVGCGECARHRADRRGQAGGSGPAAARPAAAAQRRGAGAADPLAGVRLHPRRATSTAPTPTLGRDSTIDGFALAGRIKLYRGDLDGAVESFKEAGPYAGDRAESTRRTMLLALLQPIEADTLRPLGAALLRLEQGDTTRAVGEMEAVASDLPLAKGGAELRLLAGRLAAAKGDRGAGGTSLSRGRVQGGPGHRARGRARPRGADAGVPAQCGGGDAARASHPELSRKRAGSPGEARPGRGARSGAADMRRREFLGRTSAGLMGLALPGIPGLPVFGRAAPWLLVPMDDSQSDHLKAYGLAFRLLERGRQSRVVSQLPRRRVPAARRTGPPAAMPRSRA